MQPSSFPFNPWVWRNAADVPGIGDLDDTGPGSETGTGAEDRGGRPDIGLLDYEVEAVDGRIGHVDQANAELPADCLLIDTGTWLTSHRVVLPVGAVERVDHDQRRIHVDRTRSQVKDGPEYDPDTFDATEYRQRLADYYTESYRTTPPQV